MRSSSFFTLSMAALLAGTTSLSLVLPVDEASAQRAKKDKKKESGRPDVSKEFIEPFNAANDAITAQDAVTAETKLAEAEAVATTADDKFFLGNGYVQLGSLKNDKQIQRKGLNLMLESGKTPPENIGRYNYLSGVFAYEAQEYAEAESRFKAAIDSGFSQDNVEMLYIDTIFRQDKTQEGLQKLQTTVDRLKAAGSPVDEGLYRTGVRNSANAGMVNETTYWSQQWVAAYPNETSWRDALTLFRQTASFPNAINIDLMRLMRAADAMASEQDYAEYLENADSRRLPGEVISVIEEGTAAGTISTSNDFFAENMNMAKARVSEDRSTLGDSAAAARSSSNPVVAIGTADGFLGYADYSNAIDLYTVALQKPGVDTNLVNTRLGIAQALQGNHAAAKESFAKVTGPRQELAKFWSIWVDHQSAPAGAAVPSGT